MRELESNVHSDSMTRAARIMEEYLDTFDASSEHIISINDGNGENRYAMTLVLKKRGILECNWPEIITFELDAEVALANTIFFPDDKIIWTGSDVDFKYKSEHNFAGKKYPLVEHLIVKENNLYTQPYPRVGTNLVICNAVHHLPRSVNLDTKLIFHGEQIVNNFIRDIKPSETIHYWMLLCEQIASQTNTYPNTLGLVHAKILH
eukprot:7391501-Prymnesium_polylepis.1